MNTLNCLFAVTFQQYQTHRGRASSTWKFSNIKRMCADSLITHRQQEQTKIKWLRIKVTAHVKTGRHKPSFSFLWGVFISSCFVFVPSCSAHSHHLSLLPWVFFFLRLSLLCPLLCCVPDRLAFLNDRLSLQDAARYTRELFILGYEAKRTKGKKKRRINTLAKWRESRGKWREAEMGSGWRGRVI